MNAIVLLPVYRPGQRLLSLLTDLLADGWDPADLLLVDDGSGRSADRVLAAATDLGCTVLRDPVNRGKGVALKRGLRHVAVTRAGADVITVDGDGQHRAADVRAVTDRSGRGAVVLGVRPFDRMPLRSRVGNVVTDQLFRRVTGRVVSDTQTGLRAYPADRLTWLAALPGERFEYEMNVLLAVTAAGVRIDEVPIPATYLDGNASSHFGGLADSARVIGTMVRHAALPAPRHAALPAPRSET